jgi:hypothetical protein
VRRRRIRPNSCRFFGGIHRTLAESDRDQAKRILDILMTVSAAIDRPQWADTLIVLSEQLQLMRLIFIGSNPSPANWTL